MRKTQRVIQAKTNIEWALFDMVFKPLSCCAIIVLERWFSHRANTLFDFDKFYQLMTVSARDLAFEQFGAGWTTGMIQKASSLLALFLQTDNAYMQFFRRWIKEIAKKL